jgi:hypothetical protein
MMADTRDPAEDDIAHRAGIGRLSDILMITDTGPPGGRANNIDTNMH